MKKWEKVWLLVYKISKNSPVFIVHLNKNWKEIKAIYGKFEIDIRIRSTSFLNFFFKCWKCLTSYFSRFQSYDTDLGISGDLFHLYSTFGCVVLGVFFQNRSLAS